MFKIAKTEQPIEVDFLEEVQIKDPHIFNGINYMNYTKLDIIKLYNSLFKSFITLKAKSEELAVQVSILENKLENNNIDTNYDEDEVKEYVSRNSALVVKASKTFQEELNTELSTFDEQINFEVMSKLEKVKSSFKNTAEFSVVKINWQIDMLENEMNKLSSSRKSKLSEIEKIKTMVMVSEQIRKLQDMKEKLLGRNISKSMSVIVNGGSKSKSSEQEEPMNWEEIKSSVAIRGG